MVLVIGQFSYHLPVSLSNKNTAKNLKLMQVEHGCLLVLQMGILQVTHSSCLSSGRNQQQLFLVQILHHHRRNKQLVQAQVQTIYLSSGHKRSLRRGPLTMDVEQLHVVLQQSFSPDASLRDPAEETIRNLKHVKGATKLLLQVAAEKQVSAGGYVCG